MFRYITKQKYSNSGSAMVEATLTIPFLTILVVGLYELGRLLYIYMVLSQATYEGARLLSKSVELKTGCYSEFTNIYKSSMPTSLGEANHWIAQTRTAQIIDNIYSFIELKTTTQTGEVTNGYNLSSMFIYNSGEGGLSTGTTQNQFSECQNDTSESSTVGVKLDAIIEAKLIPVSINLSVESRAGINSAEENYIVAPRQPTNINNFNSLLLLPNESPVHITPTGAP